MSKCYAFNLEEGHIGKTGEIKSVFSLIEQY